MIALAIETINGHCQASILVCSPRDFPNKLDSIHPVRAKTPKPNGIFRKNPTELLEDSKILREDKWDISNTPNIMAQ